SLGSFSLPRQRRRVPFRPTRSRQGQAMRTETIIYGMAALSTLLCAGTLGAYCWSERRWRQREQWLASLRTRPPDEPGTPPHPTDEAEPPTIPITRRPFHEALWEDEPDLAPSPQSRALMQRDRSSADRSEGHGQIVPAVAGNRPIREMSPARIPKADEASTHEEHDEMLKQKIAAAALTVGALTACQSTQPEIRRNPHPQERYEITMTIRDAPGPLANIGGSVQYDVDNWLDCMPEKFDFPLGVHREKPEEFLPLSFERIAENVFRTEITADALRDEDYHDLGVCRWKLTVVKPSLQGKTALFMPRITLDELRAQRPKTEYFANAIYSATDLEGWPESGEESPSKFSEEIRNELFTITLTPRRFAP
ncbi:MAG TPA: hypothetical protein VGD21_14435, partial [Lysobacter sp.]